MPRNSALASVKCSGRVMLIIYTPGVDWQDWIEGSGNIQFQQIYIIVVTYVNASKNAHTHTHIYIYIYIYT